MTPDTSPRADTRPIDSESGPEGGRRWVERRLRIATAGCWVGLMFASRELWMHGYIGLGFWHTAADVVRDTATTGAAIAAVVGIGIWALRDNLVASVPALADRMSGAGWVRACCRVRFCASLAVAAGLVYALTRASGPSPDDAGVAFAIALGVATAMAITGRCCSESSGVAALASLALAFGWSLAGTQWLENAHGPGSDATALVCGAGSAAAVFAILRGGEARAWRHAALAVPLVLWPMSLAGAIPRGVKAANPVDVVLIGIDTVRVDRTGLVGTHPATALTPAFDRLAARAATFSTAIASAPWTLPSFASVMTGRYPHQHGALSRQGWLRASETPLAEVLREAGYATDAVVSGVYVDSRHGFRQGFDRFDDDAAGRENDITGDDVTNRALAWIGERAEHDAPYFLFVHYFDSHYEYRDHPEWDLAEPDANARFRGLGIAELRAQIGNLREWDIALLRQLYDEEVAYTDRVVGRLLAGISALPASRRPAVVLVADHGEEILERGRVGHMMSLQEEIVHVPLVVDLPGVTRPGQVVAAPVESRSVHDTLLDYLQVDRAPRDSTSLIAILRGARPAPPVVFGSVWLEDGPDSQNGIRRAFSRAGDWKLIRDHNRLEDRLYDLSTDPAERRDLARERPDKLGVLGTALDRWLEEMAASSEGVPARELTGDERNRLQALGYLDDRDP